MIAVAAAAKAASMQVMGASGDADACEREASSTASGKVAVSDGAQSSIALELQRARIEAIKIYEKYVRPARAKLDIHAEHDLAMRVKHEIRVLASDVMATDSDSSVVSSERLSQLERLTCVFDELAQQRLNFLSSLRKHRSGCSAKQASGRSQSSVS